MRCNDRIGFLATNRASIWPRASTWSQRIWARRIGLLCALASLSGAAGCELIVDFDRSRIGDRGAAGEAGLPDPGDDASLPGEDAAVLDAGSPDGAVADDAGVGADGGGLDGSVADGGSIEDDGGVSEDAGAMDGAVHPNDGSVPIDGASADAS